VKVSASSSRSFGPSFVALWWFYFLSFVAGFLLFPVVPLHLRALGAAIAESGRFQAAFWFGSGLGCLLSGPLGDRIGQRPLLSAATLAAAGFFVVYAFLPTRWAFFLLAPLHGLMWSALRTGALAWVGGSLPPERRGEGLALFGMAAPAGVAIGPLLGLWLYPKVGFQAICLGFTVLLLGLFLMIRNLPGGERVASRPRRGLGWPEPWVLVPALILFLLCLGDGPMAPYSAQEARGLGFFWPSAYLTCLAGGMVGMRLLLGLSGRLAAPARLIPWMLATAFLGNLLLALAPGGQARHVASGLIYGAGFGMTQTLVFTHVIGRAKVEGHGAAVGALYFAFDAGIALGSLGLGWVMQASGFRWGWGLGALLVLPAILLSLRLNARQETPG
jgi:predicted MFS family arabinose efflux permease